MNTDSIKFDASFPTDAFMQDEFDVDRFLQEHCSKLGLKKLYKELGMCIKHLQLMMIDIMNSESNAIVNLSSDLKVLHSKFINIETPLGQLNEEVNQIHKNLQTNLNSVQEKIDQKENITLRKRANVNKLRVLLSCERICRILKTQTNHEHISLEILERSVDQYILQQMYCRNFDCIEFRSQIEFSTNLLNRHVRNAFLTALQTKNTTHIIRCLQMYVLMNTQNDAEQLYADYIVKISLSNVLNEDALKKCNNDLKCIYSKVLNFLNTDVKPFLNIVQKYHSNSGFNFLLNSVWFEIQTLLKLNLSSIYAPGIPDVFQRRFLETTKFLEQFQTYFANDLERDTFRKHSSYAAHQSQWNLQVYYELRHLEIAQNLEEYFVEKVSSNVFIAENKTDWKLITSKNVSMGMERCFHSDVYLPQLLDRFWKQNLQIISRYCTWIQTMIDKKIPTTEIIEKDQTLLKLKFLTFLHLDLIKLKTKLESPFAPNNLPYLNLIPEKLHPLIITTLIDPQKKLANILTSIENCLEIIIYNECSVHMKHISQIPRLFRKTNRNVPVDQSPYLSAMLKPLQDYVTAYKNEVDNLTTKRILKAVHLKIIEEYKTLVRNVLTSVLKTEESLRRLKKVRNSNGNQEFMAVGDDQKIRMQVQLDLTHYSQEAKEFVNEKAINELLSLIKDHDQSEMK